MKLKTAASILILSMPPGVSRAQMIDLGAASSFGVLAGSGVTITGATTITGDLGSFPTVAITGQESLTLNGVNHADDLTTQAAKLALTSAYLDAAARTPTVTYLEPFDLTGSILPAGVYHEPESFLLDGVLTLDAQGDPNAMWIFQAGSTLTAETGSSLLLIGGAQARNVFWQIGSSATLGVGTQFAGNILALTSISLATGATNDGRLLAQNGAVTLQGNVVSVPEPSATLWLGATGLLLMSRRGRPGR